MGLIGRRICIVRIHYLIYAAGYQPSIRPSGTPRITAPPNPIATRRSESAMSLQSTVSREPTPPVPAHTSSGEGKTLVFVQMTQ